MKRVFVGVVSLVLSGMALSATADENAWRKINYPKFVKQMPTTSVSSNGLWALELPAVTDGAIAFNLAKDDAKGVKKVLAYDTRPAGV